MSAMAPFSHLRGFLHTCLGCFKRSSFRVRKPTAPSSTVATGVAINGNAPAKVGSGIHLPSGHGDLQHAAVAAEAGSEWAAVWKKIAALEDEVGRLRSEISVLAGALTDPHISRSSSETTGTPFVVPTSAPSCFPPPPPPPPPANIQGPKQKRSHPQGSGTGPTNGPNMVDVLAELPHIKLRPVLRSPGGTPVTRRGLTQGTPMPSEDFAAILAEALKKKFKHQNHSDE